MFIKKNFLKYHPSHLSSKLGLTFHLSIAESDREPAEVAVDDLDVVVRRTGDVEDVGTAGDHLLLHGQTRGGVDHHIYHGSDSEIRLKYD